jgi:peptidoglycan/LPS O-acetylase OafA/YrhL
VRQLRESHRVLQLSGLLLGFSLYSYRVRELVVCWLFLIILFVALALLILGAVLAWYAGIYASHWVRTTTPVVPVLVLASAGVHQETNSGARQLK